MIPFPNFPSVNELLESPAVRRITRRMNPSRVMSTIGTVLDEVRHEVQTAASERSMPNLTQLAERIAARISVTATGPVRAVVNATGDIFGNRLGGPPVGLTAREALAVAARDFTIRGGPGGEEEDRVDHVEGLLRELSGAEAGTVLNHRAAACMLALATVAEGKQVVVARGHLVDLGPGYRVPDVVEAAGAKLREVGTVNRTELHEYEAAIGPNTGAIFTLLTSSVGTEDRPDAAKLSELANLAHTRRVPLICDGGDASPIELEEFGLPRIASLARLVRSGADIVIAGTRLLVGADPSGLVLGGGDRIDAIRRHALAPWFQLSRWQRRILESTLSVCNDAGRAVHETPILQLLTTSAENLHHRAGRLVPQIASLEGIAEATAVDVSAPIGNEWTLPTTKIRVRLTLGPAEELLARLRDAEPAMVAAADGDWLVIDLRSVLPRQDRLVVDALRSLSEPEASVSIDRDEAIAPCETTADPPADEAPPKAEPKPQDDGGQAQDASS